MSIALNSFTRSTLGGFIRSTLGVRGFNEGEWVTLATFVGPYADTGGQVSGSANNPPQAADYNSAWDDIPNGDGTAVNSACGFVWWNFELEAPPGTWLYQIGVYGPQSDTDTSAWATVTAATLELTATPTGNNNWSGTMTVDVRISDTAFDTDLAVAATEGTLVGTMTLGATAVTSTFDLDPGDISTTGTTYVMVIPQWDAIAEPGYPGSDQIYTREVSMSGRFRIIGTKD